MSHNILSMLEQRFDVRATLGQCMLNINGETVDCEVEKDSTYAKNPTYKVRKKKEDGGEVLCTFRPYHLHGGPFHYQIEGVSRSGGDAALIVPGNGMLERDDEEDDPDDPGSD
jgi:hypothetical protein